MDLIRALATRLLSAVAACFNSAPADGRRSWLPSGPAMLVRVAVRRVPPHLRERMAEEWGAHLNETAGNVTKLVLAIELVRASGQLRRDAGAVEVTQGASEEIQDRESLASKSQVVFDPAAAHRAIETAGAVSGWDALGYEFRQEQAVTIGRLARELRAALDALDSFDRRLRGVNAVADSPAPRRLRAHLVDTAAYALWHFVVHRECMGFRLIGEVLKDYAIPGEVQARMGVIVPAA